MENQKKTIIFDLDGTLSELKGGTFKNSGVYRAVLKNTEKYIRNKLDKTEDEARKILKDILNEYGESISIALEEKFNLNRYDYFRAVWDISVGSYIKRNRRVRNVLIGLKKDFDLVLISDAPKIWIERILNELKIRDIFSDNRIFSGEGNVRKEFGNAFAVITKVLHVKPENCIVVGDQEETDIIPAKRLGMKTILVSRSKKSKAADYIIDNILEVKKVLDILTDGKI